MSDKIKAKSFLGGFIKLYLRKTIYIRITIVAEDDPLFNTFSHAHKLCIGIFTSDNSSLGEFSIASIRYGLQVYSYYQLIGQISSMLTHVRLVVERPPQRLSSEMVD